jgi:hypothetical protein
MLLQRCNLRGSRIGGAGCALEDALTVKLSADAGRSSAGVDSNENSWAHDPMLPEDHDGVTKSTRSSRSTIGGGGASKRLDESAGGPREPWPTRFTFVASRVIASLKHHQFGHEVPPDLGANRGLIVERTS